MVRLFTYRRFQKRSLSPLVAIFSVNRQSCGLAPTLIICFAFPLSASRTWKRFCLQGESRHTCRQYPPSGGSRVRCVARKHLYPTSLASRFSTRGRFLLSKDGTDMLPLRSGLGVWPLLRQRNNITSAETSAHEKPSVG